jgi:hypothetical protein
MRRQVIAQAVAAQQHRGVVTDFEMGDFHEVLVVRRSKATSYVAINFVAARMGHGLFLAQLARVLKLAHRGMIASVVTKDALDLEPPSGRQEIIKGTAAAALDGTTAASGIIQITTKNGVARQRQLERTRFAPVFVIDGAVVSAAKQFSPPCGMAPYLGGPIQFRIF